MKDIDFLPADVARQRAAIVRLRGQIATAAIVATGLLLASAAITTQRARLAAELAALKSPYEFACSQQQRLRQLQQQLDQLAGEADLYVHLEYQWPRTQLLALLVRPLPESVSLTQLEINRDPAARENTSIATSTVQLSDSSNADPAWQDLQQLQEHVQQQPAYVLWSGHTDQSAALHELLETVSQSPMVDRARLVSLSAADNDTSGRLRFTCRLQLQEPHATSTAVIPARLTQLPTRSAQ